LPDYEISWENFNSDSFPLLTGWVTVLQKGSETSELKPEAFRLFEDGVHQPSLSVVPETESLDIVLVVDTSGSMREALARSVAAVRLFIRNLGAQDRVALVGFSDLPRVLQPLTLDAHLVDRALNQLKPDGGTALYDTLVTSASHLKPSLRRRVVVLLTDGCDQNAMGTGPGSRCTLDQAVESCRKSHATVFCVGLGFQVDRKVLGRITDETGGQAYWAAGADQLQDLYLRIVRDIRRRYRIGYQSTNAAHDGTQRSVKLVIRNGNLQGEGNTSYWVSRDPSQAVHRGASTKSSARMIPIVTESPTFEATSTPTAVPPTPPWTPSPTATREPPTWTPTSTETPQPQPVSARMSLDWNGQELGTADLGQLVVFVEGNLVSAQNCQITTLPDHLFPRAVFFQDRRAFLSPGRYWVRILVEGRLYEGEAVVEAGLLRKIALSPARNP
jgi:VWFA-related protein